MRRLLILLVLIMLPAAVWFGSRFLARTHDLEATVVLDSSRGLQRGSSITAQGEPIGRVTGVTSIEGGEAVSMRVDREMRGRVRSDSVFEVLGSPPRLEVISTLAIGAPLSEGDVIRAREGRLAVFAARQAARLSPAVAAIRKQASAALEREVEERVDRLLTNWRAEFPEWKRKGSAEVERQIEKARSEMARIEQQLRAESAHARADEVRERFTSWVEEVQSELGKDGDR